MEKLISARGMIPHRPPIAMVDSIVVDGLAQNEARALIRENNPFVNGDGLLDRACIPELVSQAAAAVNTYRSNGKCRPGMMVLGRGIKVYKDIHVNDEIRICGEEDNPMDDWHVMSFSIYNLKTGELLAQGEVGVCVF